MCAWLLVITALVVLSCLFPGTVVHWLKNIQAWLDERRVRREREIARLQTLCEAHSDWQNHLAALQRYGLRAFVGDERSHIVTRTLAAGQRYLKSIDCRQFPKLYAKTEALCRYLQRQLAIEPRSIKKGARHNA